MTMPPHLPSPGRTRPAQPRTPRRVPALPAVLAALVIVALLAALAPAAPAAQMKLEDFEVGNYPIGGAFTLVNQDGRRTSLKDLHGKVVLMAFGYTHCPDVCPTTLSLFKRVVAALGAQAKGLQPVFVSVDPKRDTPAVLKKYVGFFDPHFLALTGDADALDDLSEHYMARFRLHKPDASGAYAVDHTTLIYLLDADGKVRYLFTRDAGRDVIVQGIRTLLAARS